MRLVWSPRAIAHLVELRAFIALDQPTAAGQIAAELLAAAQALTKFPHLGRSGRITGTRELVVPNTPYMIIYRPRTDRIEIVAVFHGRRKWPPTP